MFTTPECMAYQKAIAELQRLYAAGENDSAEADEQRDILESVVEASPSRALAVLEDLSGDLYSLSGDEVGVQSPSEYIGKVEPLIADAMDSKQWVRILSLLRMGSGLSKPDLALLRAQACQELGIDVFSKLFMGHTVLTRVPLRRAVSSTQDLRDLPQYTSFTYRMFGGRIGQSLAPASVSRSAKNLIPAAITRAAEYKNGLPFRSSGRPSVRVDRNYQVLEAPGFGGSFGTQFYLVGYQNRDGDYVPAVDVVAFLVEMFEYSSVEDYSWFHENVQDTQYQASFIRLLRDLAPNGVDFAGSEARDERSGRSAEFSSGTRDWLSATLGRIGRDTTTRTITLTGVLKIVNIQAREPFVQIVSAGSIGDKLLLEPGRHDDTIGELVNKTVEVVVEQRRDSTGDGRHVRNHVVDVAAISEGDQEPDHGPAGGTASACTDLLPTSSNVVVLRWFKKMTVSDAQRPTTGSPTGLLRLTKAGFSIEARQWFRDTLFAGTWTSVVKRNRPHVVRRVKFHVFIDGGDKGLLEMEVDDAPHREAGQNNITTVIHWGRTMADCFRAANHTGKWVVIERLADDSFRLIISASRPMRRQAILTI